MRRIRLFASAAGHLLGYDDVIDSNGVRVSARERVFWGTAGNIVYSAAQFLIIVLLAQESGVEGVGHFSFALALTSPVLVFASLNLRLRQSVDVIDQYRFREYLLARLTGLAIGNVLILGIAVVLGLGVGMVALIMTLSVSKSVEWLSDLGYGLLQRHERLDEVGRSQVGRGLLQILGIVLVLQGWPSAFGAAIGHLIGSLAALLLLDIRATGALLGVRSRGARPMASLPTGRWPEAIARTKQLIRASFSLGIMGLLGSLYQSEPRYFLQATHGASELGVFTAAFYLSFVPSALVNALGAAAMPRLARAGEQGRVAFRATLARLVFQTLIIGGIGVLGALTMGSFGMRILYGSAMDGRTDVLVALMIAAVPWYAGTALSFGAISLGSSRGQAWIFLLGAVVVGVTSALFIPSWGVMGASISLGAGVSAILIAEAILVTKQIGLLGSPEIDSAARVAG